jgi:hypothetical protein
MADMPPTRLGSIGAYANDSATRRFDLPPSS